MSDPVSWSHSVPLLIAALVFGYVLGSTPFGLLLTRLGGLGDVRKIGSGNIGATNVLRTGNKKLAALTLLGDMLKGTLAVIIADAWGQDAAIMAGMGAFLGHLFPFWLRFQGGKGVATYVGILLGLYWPAFVLFAFIWIGTAYFTRYSSLSALVASALIPFSMIGFGQWPLAELFAVLSALLWIKHRQNINRLLDGTESRIGGGKDKTGTAPSETEAYSDAGSRSGGDELKG
jgi:acyl phosphate:glycerol-3-phosphate acyltransferase